MDMILGRDLDGAVYRRLPACAAEAGTFTAGLQGFIALLEERYGLPPVLEDAVLRVFQYERALRGTGDRERFYSASFDADSFGVAEKLLAVRDELMLASGGAEALTTFREEGNGHPRLVDLAAVEARVGDVTPGPAERLRAVLAAMAAGDVPPPVDRLTLVDALATWPGLAQQTLTALTRAGVTIEPWKPPPAQVGETDTDLATARRSLAGEATTRRARNDGSLFLVSGFGRVQAADLAANLVGEYARRHGTDNVAVIDSWGDGTLDDALARAGLPLCGGAMRSWGLESRQVLPMFLLLLFQPPDPGLMHRYLLLADSPLPAGLRRRLSSALQASPAVGSRVWREAIQQWLADAQETGGAEEGRVRIATWIEAEGVAPGGRLSVSRVQEACDRLIAWATRRAHAGNDDEQAGVFEFAAEAARLLRRVSGWRASSYTPSELARLLADLDRMKPSLALRVRESGAPVAVDHPGAMLSCAAAVVWVGADEASFRAPPRAFFSRAELDALTAAGVSLPAPEVLLRRETEAAERAVTLAGRVSAWVYGESVGEASGAPHPLWHRLMRGFATEPDPRNRLSFGAREIVEGERGPAGLEIRNAQAARPVCLAGFRDRWQLAAGALGQRETDSPSSIEKLVSCPFGYVLRYEAGIQEDEPYLLPDGCALLGQAAHAVLEPWIMSLDPEGESDPEREARELGATFDRYTVQEAATLAAAGREAERARVRDAVIRSGRRLAEAVRQGGFRPLGPAQTLARRTAAGRIEGRADIVLVRRDDPEQLAVIDLKWGGGGGGFYRKAMEGGRALQLAAYARLAGDRPAPTAYLILSTAQLITVHPGVFPGADVVLGPTETEVWQGLEEAVLKGRQALAEGVVDVGLPEGDWTEDRGLLVPAACSFCGYRLFCRIDQAEGERP